MAKKKKKPTDSSASDGRGNGSEKRPRARASRDLANVTRVLNWIENHQSVGESQSTLDYVIAEGELGLERNVIKDIIRYVRVLLHSVNATNKGFKFKGRGPADSLERAMRRGEIFALLHHKQEELKDESGRTQITAQEVVDKGLAAPATAETDLDAIYDFAHSMRLTEEGLKVGRYAFSNSLAREKRHTKLKDEIAAEVAELVSPGASCACTQGSTPARCLRAILAKHQHVSVVTNNCLIFQGGAIEHAEIFVCGGNYDADSQAMTGSRAEAAFRRRPCEIAIAGAYAIDARGRAYVYHNSDCSVQFAAVTAAQEKVILACDKSKLAKPGRWAFLDLYDYAERNPSVKVILATNEPDRGSAAEKLVRELKEKNIDVIYKARKASRKK